MESQLPRSMSKANVPQLLRRKKILVTGAGTGIGRGIAIEFARFGADVALHFLDEQSGVRSAIKQIESFGGRCAAFQADFRESNAACTLAAKAEAFLGRIDVLVNNAGITATIPFEATSDWEFEALLGVNFKALFFLSQAVAAGMIRRRRGVILNLSSPHATGGFPQHSVYAATKGAIDSLTRQLAIELAPSGIRVNAINPGWCLTENQLALFGTQFAASRAGRSVPLGRLAKPSDIGRVAVALASDLAAYITGQIINCDGGMSAMLANAKFGESPKARFGARYLDARRPAVRPRG